MNHLTFFEPACSDIQTFVPGMCYDQVSFVGVLAMLDPHDIEPVTHMIALSRYNVHLVINGIFVEIESAVVFGRNEGVFVLAFLPMHTELLLSFVIVSCYVDFVVVADCQAFRLV